MQFVGIGEHRLRVIEIGTGEPVLLVHGFADSAYTWHRNLRALVGAGFRVLAYDHPGYGQSALPAGARFGVDDLTRLAVGLLDALGIAWAHLVGHSMGGGVGLHLAIYYPGRLRRVVLVAPTCYRAPLNALAYLSRCSFLSTVGQRLAGPWLIWPILRSMYRDPALLTPQVVAQYRSAFRRPEYRPACAAALRDYWNGAFKRASQSYREIRLPLYLVWGERDTWVAPRYGLRLASDTGAGLTIIPGAGHVVHQAKPNVFDRTVVSFLASG